MSAASPAPSRIDVHHHVIPPQFVASTPLPMGVPTVEQQLEAMDRNGIAVALVSLTPRINLAHPGDEVAVTRACNEFEAELLARHPTRFGAFGMLPLPHVDAALEEITYIMDVLHLDGVGFFSSVEHCYLGDPRLDPIFDELQRRKAIAFVHPAHAEAPAECNLGAPGGAIEYGIDTTRAIVNLLWQETLRTRPDVRMIFSHGGGAAPFFTNRILGIKGPQRRAEVLATLRSFYYDVASLMGGSYGLRSVQELADPTHVLWGSDMPFVSPQRVAEELVHWENDQGLDAAARAVIERENPLRLFPRLASSIP